MDCFRTVIEDVNVIRKFALNVKKGFMKPNLSVKSVVERTIK